MYRNTVLLLIWFVTFAVFGESKYSLHEEWLSMAEAASKCNQQGKNLASVENLEDWEELVQVMLDGGYDKLDVENGRLFWTAGTNWKNPDDAQYFWLTSGNPVPTVLYAEGQPDGAKFHCIQIINNDNPDHLGYHGFALFNTGCDYIFMGYACQTRPCAP